MGWYVSGVTYIICQSSRNVGVRYWVFDFLVIWTIFYTKTWKLVGKIQNRQKLCVMTLWVALKSFLSKDILLVGQMAKIFSLVFLPVVRMITWRKGSGIMLLKPVHLVDLLMSLKAVPWKGKPYSEVQGEENVKDYLNCRKGIFCYNWFFKECSNIQLQSSLFPYCFF